MDHLPNGSQPLHQYWTRCQAFSSSIVYQNEPVELVSAKEYVMKILKSDKIRRNTSAYGSPLFIVKETGRALQAVVN